MDFKTDLDRMKERRGRIQNLEDDLWKEIQGNDLFSYRMITRRWLYAFEEYPDRWALALEWQYRRRPETI